MGDAGLHASRVADQKHNGCVGRLLCVGRVDLFVADGSHVRSRETRAGPKAAAQRLSGTLSISRVVAVLTEADEGTEFEGGLNGRASAANRRSERNRSNIGETDSACDGGNFSSIDFFNSGSARSRSFRPR